jgi:Cohesin domain
MLLAFLGVLRVSAQSAETIWLSAGTTAYKTGETVIATLNTISTTPIQGFTFQIRYDPSCLRPVNASSNIPGMNGLQLPQISGLVDGSYASTTPQPINGVLAEVRFTALKGCQTGLTLESAALAVRNAEGFAAPLTNVLVGERNIALNIDSEVVASQPIQVSGSVLPLDPPPAETGFAGWIIGGLIILLFAGVGLGAYKFFRIGG